MSSLRLKLVLAVALIVVAAVVAVGLSARQATVSNFQRFLATERGPGPAFPDLSELVEPIAEAYAEGGPTGVERFLRSWRRDSGSELDLLLLDSDDRLIASSNPSAESWSFETPGQGDIRARRRGARAEVVQLRVPSVHVTAAEGGPIGDLYPFQLPTGRMLDHETLFVSTVSRGLLVSVLIAGAAAIALAWLATRRLLGPIEALTGAANRLGAGDLSQRVPAEAADEVGQLARAFNSMAASIERNERTLREMVSDTAHELRTPITNLRCQIEALQDGLIPTDGNAVRSLHEEVVLLQKLAEDLQVLALADAGELRLETRPCALDEEAARAVRSILAARGEPEREIVPALGGLPAVRADPLRLQQVLTNLLSNALDHTPVGGEIRITGRTRGAEIEVAVRDDGTGIAAEHLPRIFERFYRPDPSRQRATGGAGLGLAIVKRLVEAQGGSVALDSTEGDGTRVVFTLPVA